MGVGRGGLWREDIMTLGTELGPERGQTCWGWVPPSAGGCQGAEAAGPTSLGSGEGAATLLTLPEGRGPHCPPSVPLCPPSVPSVPAG